MKGIVLAGGLGSRLRPLTNVTNKHLLPIFNKPMIYYSIEKLVQAGVEDVMIVTGGTSAGDFMRLLGNGSAFGLKSLYYAYQEGEGGIAHALSLTEHFASGGRIAVILGDNVIEDNIKQFSDRFQKQKRGARILLKEVDDAHRFGVAEIQNKKIVRIVEKPKKPKSKLAVTGLYFYDSDVFDIVKTLKPSARGELEITDVNNEYLKRGSLEYDILNGLWTDAGTFESLLRANRYMHATAGRHHGQKGR
ncbi:MAG: NTP transferase domain-containing protein [Candidatus Omnitrophica bacterium]|nr:NTP transferase domain-containing protein [Candidatus Omnitrophota bacterium]